MRLKSFICALFLIAVSGIATEQSLFAQGTLRRGVPEGPDKDSQGNLKLDEDPLLKSRRRVHGSVTISDGTVPAQLVEIEATCPGLERAMAIADSKGKFSFFVEPDRLSDSTLVKGCALYASLEGYRSDTVRLVDLTAKDEKAGQINLHALAANLNGFTSANDSQVSGKQQKLYERSLDKAAKQDWHGAIASLQELVADNPSYSSAWLTLGILQQMQGDRTSALKSFIECAHADPKFALPLVRAASIETIQGNMAAALTHSQAAIDLNPAAFPDAYAMNALANINAQNLDAAEKSAREGLKLGADRQYPELEYALGIVLYSKDDRKGAAEHLQKYLQEFPNGPNAPAAKNQLTAMFEADAAVKRNIAAADEQSAGPMTAAASTAPAPASDLIRLKNARLLTKMSAYTCLESVSSATIDTRGHLSLADLIRVDIGVSEGKEIYSSADAKHFAGGSGHDLLGYGFSTTGLFSSMASAVIAGDQLAIERVGDFLLEGQPVVRYNFRSLPSTPDWMISYGSQSGRAREEGWFLLDRKTLVLRRVFVKAASISQNLKLSNLSALIDYTPKTIAGSRVLLPSIARVELGERSGSKRASIVSFDHCHAFTSESTLSFDTESQESTKAASGPVHLPIGAELSVTTNAPLSPANDAESDVFTATITKPVMLNGRVLIESGAVVEGHFRPKNGENAVVVELDRVNTQKGWAPFYAQLVRIDGSNQVRVRARSSDQQKAQSLVAGGDYAELADPDVPGVATINFSNSAASLPAGTQLIWKAESLVSGSREALQPQTRTSLGMR